EVVGDVGGEVGVEAIFALHDAVLLVAEGGRAEPPGAVLQVDVALLLELGHRALDQAGVEQALLREPLVETHAELAEVVTAIAELLVEGKTMHPAVVVA